jgi:hypothetical protein
MPHGFDGCQKVFDTRIIRITGPDVVDPYDLVDIEAGGSGWPDLGGHARLTAHHHAEGDVRADPSLQSADATAFESRGWPQTSRPRAFTST